MAQMYMSGAAYVLGEQKRTSSTVEGFEEAAEAMQIPAVPKLMGIDSFFVTNDIYQCASESIGKTLGSSGVAPLAIEQVIFCSSFFKEPFLDRNRELGKICDFWNISPQRIWGISASGCTDVLASIDLACTLVKLGRAQHALVVGVESAQTSDADRLLSYALISDSAASAIISNEPFTTTAGDAFEIIATAVSSDVKLIGKGMTISDSPPNRPFIQNFLGGADRKLSDVTKVFSNNLFLPVKTGREALAGFTRGQMYLDNVPRTGHCLGCDSIINLVDFKNGRLGDQYLLYSEAEGHTGCVLLRRCP